MGTIDMQSVDHPVRHAVRHVAEQATRWQRLRATARLITTFLIVAGTTSLLDYLFRVQDVGVRTILSLVTWFTVGYSAWRYLIPSIRFPLSDLQVARRLEQHWPGLQSRLSSSLVFLNQGEDDPLAGSAELRRAVISQTEGEISQYDLLGALNLQRPRATVRWCGVLVCGLIVFTLWRPADVGRSLQRLVVPWNATEWPRINTLSFSSPSSSGRIAVGSSVEFRVVDEGRELPRSVMLQVVFAGDELTAVREYEMEFRGGEMLKVLDNVTRSLRYRAQGGDDNRPEWHTLSVVNPPRVTHLSLALQAPEYTGWPVESVDGNTRVLAGTTIGLVGTATQSLNSARLVVHRADNQQQSFPLTVDSSSKQTSFRTDENLAWMVDSSVEYWIEMIGKSGVTSLNDQKWQLTVVPDRPPTISFRQPLATELLATSALPIEIIAQDDLAIHTVTLRYSRSDQSDAGERELELYRGTIQVAPAANDESISHERPTGIASLGSEKSVQVSYAWNLADLGDFGANTTIDITLITTDFNNQEATTGTSQVRLVTAAELIDRVAQQQSEILEETAELLAMQREILTRTEEVRARGADLAKDDDAQRARFDRLQAIELNQRDIHARLTDNDDAVLARIGNLSRQLQINNISQSEIGDRLKQMEAKLLELQHTELAPLQRRLTDMVKEVSGNTAPPTAVDEEYQLAIGHQQRIVAALEQIVDQQTVWDSIRQFAREAEGMLREQREIQSRLHEALNGSDDDGQPVDPDRATRESLARRQSDAARRFDKLMDHLQDASESPHISAENVSSRLSKGLAQGRREAIGGRMRDVAQMVRQGQVGRAAVEQTPIIDALQDLTANLMDSGMPDAQPEGVTDTGAQQEEQRQREQQQRMDRQLARLEQLVRGWHVQQSSYRDDLEKLIEQRQQQVWSAGQIESVRVLADQQHGLVREMQLAVTALTDVRAFVLAIESARHQIELAATALRSASESESSVSGREPAERAIRHQHLAITRLEQVLSALQQDQLASEQPASPTDQSPNAESNKQASDDPAGEQAARRMEELKLLKVMQQEIAARTQVLDEARMGAGGLSEQEQRELEYLASEQGEVVRILQQIVDQTTAPSSQQ